MSAAQHNDVTIKRTLLTNTQSHSDYRNQNKYECVRYFLNDVQTQFNVLCVLFAIDVLTESSLISAQLCTSHKCAQMVFGFLLWCYVMILFFSVLNLGLNNYVRKYVWCNCNSYDVQVKEVQAMSLVFYGLFWSWSQIDFALALLLILIHLIYFCLDLGRVYINPICT